MHSILDSLVVRQWVPREECQRELETLASLSNMPDFRDLAQISIYLA